MNSSATCYTWTALHYAAIGKHEDVFQLLLEAGINVSPKDYFRMTASGYAFSSTVDAVESNSRKRLCQRPSNRPPFRGFPSPPPFPDLFPDFGRPRREVDSTATSSLQGTANAKELQEEGPKYEA